MWIKDTQTAFPLASPQVVQTRKQSRSRNCRAEDSLQIPFNPWPGQANSSVSAWRAGWTVFSQGSSFLLPALGRPHEKKNLFSLQKHRDFPTFISSSQLENLPGDVSMNLTTISALKLTKITKHLFFHMLFSYLHRCPCASQPFPLCCFCTRSVLFCQVQTFKSGTEMKVCSLHRCILLSVLITLFIRTPSSVLF